MLPRLELALVLNLTTTNWVRAQLVDVTAQEGLAAARGTIRRRAAFVLSPRRSALLDAAARRRALGKGRSASAGL
jgi:hypothetical protein